MADGAWTDSFDLVIFDHDGVLVDSEIIAMTVIARLLSEHGVPMSVDGAIERFLGGSLDAVIAEIEATGVDVDHAAFDRAFHDALFEGFRRDLDPIPGMHELLTALNDRGIPIAIASSGSAQRVRLGITTTDLLRYFPDGAITTRDDVTRGKPFPDLFLLAAQRADVAPDRCLVVEDSPYGVEAAHRAGMKVVALSYRTPADRLSAADWVVFDAASVLDVL
jgi:HAD superfamily hydrolase (TIGR01509 family)